MVHKIQDKALKYLKLKNTIIDNALTEQWPHGHRLPSENKLVEIHAVSRSTVRQALDQLERDGLVTRQRGRGTFYTPGAKGSQDRDHLIGVSTSLSGYIYSAIVRGAEEELSARGYHSVVGQNLLAEGIRANVAQRSPQWRLDGLLFEPQVAEKTGIVERVKASGIPSLMINWTTDDPEVPWIAPDDQRAGETVAQYLLDRGHRRMAFVGIKGHQPTQNRLAGFRRRLQSLSVDLPPDLVTLVEEKPIEERIDDIYAATKQLLETKRPLPTAIFFFSDQTAAEGYHAIKDAGLSIPEDISVISYDNSELGRALAPRLTTMAHPKEELGRWAARMLLELIEEPAKAFVMQVKMQSTIIERDSVRVL
jgi:GntR family transcriptional regulator, arabinose operon transcriptional repressor